MLFKGTRVFIGSLQGSKMPTAASKKLDFLLKTYIKILFWAQWREEIVKLSTGKKEMLDVSFQEKWKLKEVFHFKYYKYDCLNVVIQTCEKSYLGCLQTEPS